jgi:hypothetical protein
MLRADSDEADLEVYFRQPEALQGMIVSVEPKLDTFIEFLGHTTSIEKPAPGLGLSYGETVGAIHQIWLQKSIKADFRAEQDRILAAIMRQTRDETVTERPEFTPEPDLDASSGSARGSLQSDLGRLNSDLLPPTSNLPQTANQPNK